MVVQKLKRVSKSLTLFKFWFLIEHSVIIFEKRSREVVGDKRGELCGGDGVLIVYVN
jgi:hypothetical protein